MYSFDDIIAEAIRFTSLGYQLYLTHTDSKTPINYRPIPGIKSGIYASTADPTTIVSLIQHARNIGHQPNLALRLTLHDALVVIDADTPEAIANLQKLAGQPLTPYVTTPGTADQKHYGGGHFYFTLPPSINKEDYPTVVKLFRGSSPEHDVDIKLWDTGVLLPPSYRNRGHYQYVDREQPILSLPEPICNALIESLKLKDDCRSHVSPSMSAEDAEVMNDWGKQISWEELLIEDGWVATGRRDRCGCAEWSRPGNPSPQRSAVAHDEDCAAGMPPILFSFSTTASEAVRRIIDECNGGQQYATKYQVWREVFYPDDYKMAFKASGLAGKLTARIDAITPEDWEAAEANNELCPQPIEAASGPERVPLVEFKEGCCIRAFEDFDLLEKVALHSWIALGEPEEDWRDQYQHLDPFTIWKISDYPEAYSCLSVDKGYLQGFATVVRRISDLESCGAWISEQAFCVSLAPVIGLTRAKDYFHNFVVKGRGPEVLRQLDLILSRVGVRA